jgi:aspartate/tyrosine/aromatic aminotransferase
MENGNDPTNFDWNLVRKVVAVVCPDPHQKHSGGLATQIYLRYVVLFYKEKAYWYDNPSWENYRVILNQAPWAKNELVLAPCTECAGGGN